MHAVLGSVFLHLHPARLPKHAVKVGYTWCMGGLSFFLFVNLTITGILLMFYYRPTVEYAYTDVIDLTEQVPTGYYERIAQVGRTCNGSRRMVAHAARIHDWVLQTSKRIQLGCRCFAYDINYVYVIYRLFVALGPISNMGCDCRL